MQLEESMGDFFKVITSGIARYAFAWVLPSAITIGTLLVVLVPSLPEDSLLPEIVERASTSPAIGAATLTFCIIVLAVVGGYLSQASYRLLEGYHLPKFLERPLLRRQLRTWWITQRLADRQIGRSAQRGLLAEKRFRYPEEFDDVMPTKFGNALRAAETYGVNRWNLDTVSLWYELLAFSPAVLQRELDDSESAMEFFASTIVQLGVMILVSIALIPQADNLTPLWVAVVALSIGASRNCVG
jgi:hypothetical protein